MQDCDKHHTPHPSVTTFEHFLGGLIAARRCDGCKKPLGPAPRIMLRHKQYHSACNAKIEELVRVLEGESDVILDRAIAGTQA